MEGLEQGEKIGMIHILESLLNQAKTPRDQLLLLSMEELAQMGDALKAQLAKERMNEPSRLPSASEMKSEFPIV